MPKKYEAIRDQRKAEGLGDAMAKTYAAKVYNTQRKPGQQPVTSRHKSG